MVNYMSPYDLNVGVQIRYLRKKKDLTLKDLAESSGLSVNAISRIENGQTSPTVSTVHRLAVALGVPIASIFDGSAASTIVYTSSNQRHKTYLEGRTVETLGSGMIDPLSEPFLITLEGRERTRGESSQHPGEEFAYCLEGNVNFIFGNSTHTLRAGDSLLFKSDQPHAWENPTDVPARFLLIFVKGDQSDHTDKEHHNILSEFIPVSE